jgi:L-xylulokinase
MVASFGPGRFVSIESSATSAANLEWFVHELDGNTDPFDRCNALVGSVKPSSDDPFFHPFLYGSRQGASFRAGFYGVAGWHGKAHILRAIYEGVMFEHRRHIDVLRAAGLAFDRAVMSGGGARSPHWPQIFADGLGVPITVSDTRETGALGAAIGAGVGVGLFEDYEAGTAAMTHAGVAVTPDPDMEGHYDSRYRMYCSLTQALRPFWTALWDSRDSGR